jgi:hypothetical protein
MSDWPPGMDDKSSQTKQQQASLPVRLVQWVSGQIVALVFFVGFPAVVTWGVPVSWVRFERHDGQVSATAKTCLFYFIPYRTTTIEPVTGLGDRFVAGAVGRDRRSGSRGGKTKAEDQGFLVIKGNDQSVEVPVTPFNLDSVEDRCEAFLEDSDAAELNLFVVANWKFSIIVGGFLSMLAVLYFGTIAFGLILKLVHSFQWALGIPADRRWLARLQKDSEKSLAKARKRRR